MVIIMYFNNLKKLRNEKEFTQEEVAFKLNCKRSTYNNWESGVVMIPLDVADKLSLIYNVSLSCILGIENKIAYKSDIKAMDYNVLLNNLNRVKKERGQTFGKIANSLNCNQATCCRYFNGNIIIPIDRLIMLSELYNVDLDCLCGK